jgi:hypothetical protein
VVNRHPADLSAPIPHPKATSMPLAAPPLMRDILDADLLTEMVRQG